MSFVDPVFLLLFVPVILLVYNIVQRSWLSRGGIWVLVIASLIFYSMWNPRFLPVLLFSALANFYIARLIDASESDRRRKLFLVCGLTGNLLGLAFFKYTNFIVENLEVILGLRIEIPEIHLPLGISFFTFTQIAYITDIYRRKGYEPLFQNYLLFVSYFPHLIAGPIFHHAEMMGQFRQRLREPLRLNRLTVGATFVAIGLFKKVILADGISIFCNPTFDAAAAGALPTLFESWTAVLAYTLQLYFDFSGYCDMAIGLSFMFGIRLPINFNSPYKATSIIEFWRRWHMTLSRFLREYLYVPLGGNRRGRQRQMVNIMSVMVLGGLWHGAGWTFVAWGALHGAYVLVNHVWRAVVGPPRQSVLARLRGRILTFFSVVIAWVFFRAADVETALRMVRSLFGFNGIVVPSEWLRYPGINSIVSAFNLDTAYAIRFLGIPAMGSVAILLLIVWFMPNSQEIMARFNPTLERAAIPNTHYHHWRPTVLIAIVFSLLSAVAIQKIIFHPAGDFLYFQF